MASAYPSSIPAYTQNGGQNNTTDTLSVNQHTSRHQQHQDDIIAIANKLGTGVSLPSNNQVLRANGSGTGYDSVHANTDVTGVLGVGNGGTGTTTLGSLAASLEPLMQVTILGVVFPVGCIYTETTGVNPATTFGIGTWLATGQGQVLIGNGTSDQVFVAGTMGGESNHTLTGGETPIHNHTITAASGSGGATFNQIQNTGSGGVLPTALGVSNFGGGAAHNNLPPYLVVYFWQRTA
jgi:microcystin-dependent protein